MSEEAKQLLNLLLEVIAKELKDKPQSNPKELANHLEDISSKNFKLADAVNRMVQINQDDAKSFQTLVEGGTALIGLHYHIDVDTLKKVLKTFINQDANYSNYDVFLSYLKEHDWKKADRETFYIMRQLVGLPDIKILRNQELLECHELVHISSTQLDEFRCDALCLIDNAWRFYSNNKFGFSVQNDIYTSIIGNKKEVTTQDWENFGKKVGWYKDEKWIDTAPIYKNNDIPRGHYPLDVIGGKNWDESKEWVYKLISRLKTCKYCLKKYKQQNL